MPENSVRDDAWVTTVPAQARPLAQTLLDWIVTRLRQRGYAMPVCKRLAVLIGGLMIGRSARRGDLVTAIAELAVSSAKPESIHRRVERMLDDPRLDPSRLLPNLFADMLPVLLKGEIAAHAANRNSAPAHHARFCPLRLIIDESSQDERVHILVASLGYRGIALPLAIRVWEQNVPLPAGTYWAHLLSVLSEVQEQLPPELRDHVLLLADRGFGVPRLVDAANALGWFWLLRIQGQTRIRRADGTVLAARAVVTKPGQIWCSGFGRPDLALEEIGPTAVFQGAGWRPCQVVAAWEPTAAEPWLLITNLPASHERYREYAQRWAIERLFLSWKSHGWDIEGLMLATPAVLGRLLSGLAAATLWTLVVALPEAAVLLDDLAKRAQRRDTTTYQLCLPFCTAPRNRRPYPAKFSLLNWGRKVLERTVPSAYTPARCWVFPDWNAPPWSVQCEEVYHPAA